MNLRNLTPGDGWTRPYHDAGIFEDHSGNRCKPVTGCNFVALLAKGARPIIMRCDEEPLRSAIRRNPSMRRAGLAAARVVFEEARR